MRKLLLLFLGISFGLFLSAPAQALDFDFAGNFQYDNDILKFTFTVGQTSTVTVFSSSWLSGNGGGFDPILAVWDSSGNKMYEQDDGLNIGNTDSNNVSYAHGYWDTYFQVTLNPGTYIASVAQYSNFSNTSLLADGFRYDNNPNFTYDYGYGGATQPYFNGVWDSNDPRTSAWAFHILNVQQATGPSVPEPASMLLLGSGLVGLAAFRKRFKLH